MRVLRVSLHLNLALTYLRETNYQDAIKSATAALDLNPDKIDQGKAYTRRGKAYASSRNDQLAIEDLKKAVELLPSDQANAAKTDLEAVKKRMKLRKDKERKVYAAMFQ